MYIIARMRWADGYISDGNPDNRYAKSGGWGFHIWTSLLATYVTAASTGLGVMGVL